ncbi:MAG: serine/threonine-protein phosphatase [Henriciella sp.]|nr:serine/threonine-protein phosphatase [Henriciella sp.]
MIVTSASSPKKPGVTNQDSAYSAASGENAVLAVADGIGGRPNGEIASHIATSVLADWWDSGRAPNESLFSEVVNEIRNHPEERKTSGMGTTLSFAWAHDQLLDVFHVGDGLVAHLRGEGIVRLTRPQNEAQRLLEQGVISKTVARRYRRRNVLTSALTASSSYEVQSVRTTIARGDRILICTDGLTEILGLREISSVSTSSPSINEFGEGLNQLVDSRGAVDDYSFSILEYS